MSISSDRSRRVTKALAEADNVLQQQGEWGLQLKCGGSLIPGLVLVTVSVDGQPVNTSRLDTAPATFQSAWHSMENDPLLKIAVWYALLFSEQTLEDSERIDEETFKVELGEKSDLLILPVERSVAQNPDEAFADAVEVYVRRMDEVDAKGAARLRRAIRAGYLEFTSAPFDLVAGWDEMTRAGINTFIGKHIWIMPRRENFTDSIGVQAHDKNGGIEAAAAAGQCSRSSRR